MVVALLLPLGSVQAQIVPRLMYVVPNYLESSSPPSFMGEYWNVGATWAVSATGLSGPSVKYGFGDTGEKLNLSYLMGSGQASMEVGVSYIKQKADATLLVNPEREGYLLEVGLRFNLWQVLWLSSKTDSSVELAVGF